MAARASRLLGALSTVAGGVGITAGVLNTCTFTVDGGERAVVLDNVQGGVLPKVYGEGFHFMIPIIQKPFIYDVKSTPRVITSDSGSKDLQEVQLSLRLLYRPIHERLPKIHDNLGEEYASTVLPGMGKEVLKAVVAQFNAEELITQRDLVSERVREALVKRAQDFGIVFDDISITHLSFSPDFERSVERKQVEFVNAERARYVVERTEQEKQAAIIRAEGDGKAAALISAAIQNAGSGIIELRKIEAAKEIAATLSRSRNVAYLPPTQGLLMNMQA